MISTPSIKPSPRTSPMTPGCCSCAKWVGLVGTRRVGVCKGAGVLWGSWTAISTVGMKGHGVGPQLCDREQTDGPLVICAPLLRTCSSRRRRRQCAPTSAALSCSRSSRIAASTARPHVGAAVQPPGAMDGRKWRPPVRRGGATPEPLHTGTPSCRRAAACSQVCARHLSFPTSPHPRHPPPVAKNSMPGAAKASARRGLVMRPAMGQPLPHGLPAGGGGDRGARENIAKDALVQCATLNHCRWNHGAGGSAQLQTNQTHLHPTPRTKRHNVGGHALQLKGPEGAAHAPKAALHLVRHAHRARSAHLWHRARWEPHKGGLVRSWGPPELKQCPAFSPTPGARCTIAPTSTGQDSSPHQPARPAAHLSVHALQVAGWQEDLQA